MRVMIGVEGGYLYMCRDDVGGDADVPNDIWEEYKKHVEAFGKWQKYIHALEKQSTVLQRRPV